MSNKFKVGQKVKFIGGLETDYHPEYVAIQGKEGVITYSLPNDAIKWKYEITIDGIEYPVSEDEIEGV